MDEEDVHAMDIMMAVTQLINNMVSAAVNYQEYEERRALDVLLDNDLDMDFEVDDDEEEDDGEEGESEEEEEEEEEVNEEETLRGQCSFVSPFASPKTETRSQENRAEVENKREGEDGEEAEEVTEGEEKGKWQLLPLNPRDGGNWVDYVSESRVTLSGSNDGAEKSLPCSVSAVSPEEGHSDPKELEEERTERKEQPLSLSQDSTQCNVHSAKRKGEQEEGEEGEQEGEKKKKKEEAKQEKAEKEDEEKEQQGKDEAIEVQEEDEVGSSSSRCPSHESNGSSDGAPKEGETEKEEEEEQERPTSRLRGEERRVRKESKPSYRSKPSPRSPYSTRSSGGCSHSTSPKTGITCHGIEPIMRPVFVDNPIKVGLSKKYQPKKPLHPGLKSKYFHVNRET